MDHIINCKKDCAIISGEGISTKELDTLKDMIGDSVFSKLSKIKKNVDNTTKSNIDTNDLLSFMVGMFTLSEMT